MRNIKTLILEEKTIRTLIDMKRAIACIERAFKAYALGKTQMPSKIYLNLTKHCGDFRAMPAYIEGKESCALKWVNVHPKNKSKGLPTVMAVLILSDPRNGFPLCIMDGTYATSLRTAAAGAVAAKYLARKDSDIIGLVGCGEQARSQLTALDKLFKIREVKVWGHKEGYTKEFIKAMRALKLKLTPVKSVKECAVDSDIIVTTTPSKKPLVKHQWLSSMGIGPPAGRCVPDRDQSACGPA